MIPEQIWDAVKWTVIIFDVAVAIILVGRAFLNYFLEEVDAKKTGKP